MKFKITLTKKAAAELKKMQKDDKKTGFGLKFDAYPGGCAGLQYFMDFAEKKEKDEEKDKIMSMSDTDARMMGKKKEEIHPTYKSHNSMSQTGFITYTDVTHATTYDGHQANNAVSDLKSRGFKVPKCVGDTHYGDINFREAMAEQMTQVIAPYRQNQIMNSCMTEDVMIEAWAFNHTEEYKEHMKIRAHIEPKQGEMKNLHGMKRAKLRGLGKVKIQNYISAVVTNCKRWVAVAS